MVHPVVPDIRFLSPEVVAPGAFKMSKLQVEAIAAPIFMIEKKGPGREYMGAVIRRQPAKE